MGTQMHTIGHESGRKAFEIYRKVCMEDNRRERTQNNTKLGIVASCMLPLRHVLEI
jgi:hypothetical protein